MICILIWLNGQSLRSRSIPTPIVPVASTSQLLPPTLTPSSAPAPEGLSADHSYVPLSGRIPTSSTSQLTSVSSTPISKKKNDAEVIVVSALEDRPKKIKRKRTPGLTVVDDEGGLEARGESSPQKKESTKKRSKLTPPASASPLEPHDYSLTPSFLDIRAPITADQVAVAAISKERKRKDKKDKLAKGFATVEGDKGGFGRAPRVNNAPKKGNLAMSFSK